MDTIFICYRKSTDKQFATKLYFDLKRLNFNTWMDEESLLGGENWKTTINKIIPDSAFVLIVISKDAIKAEKGFYHNEIKLAIESLRDLGPDKRYIIPLRIDDVEPNYDELKNCHWVDFIESYENGFRKLVKSIRCAQDLYQIVDKKELVQIYKDHLIAYLPLKDDLRDISEKTISTCLSSGEACINPKFDNEGLFFDGNFVVQIENKHLPFGTHPRTFCLWCKFWPDIPMKDNDILEKHGVEGKYDKFIFSYGDVQQRDATEHGRAFGLFYGIPFFQAKLEREFGFRVFMWCVPYLWNQGDRECDTGQICSGVANQWYFLCITYDGKEIKSYVNNQQMQTERRDKSTKPSELLNIGGFLPHLEGDYDFFNFEGYIREFMIFNRVLNESEINQIYNSTKELLCCRID